MSSHPLKQADATTLLVRWLREPDHGDYGSYGYGVYLPALVRTHLRKQGVQHDAQEARLRDMIPMLYAAAWDLCRRGILRPGVRAFNAQATADGASGNGYSITPFGYQWLAEADRDDFVPTEPEGFAQMLAPYQARFGPSFQERGQEAIRCYGAHAYLACCTMCGAAAEAILLATAIAKKNEAAVLRQYNASGGRRRVENVVVGKVRQELRDEYIGYTTLLKYWRDQAAHGKLSGIKDNEAYTSLALLLRFALFVNENWEELVARWAAASIFRLERTGFAGCAPAALDAYMDQPTRHQVLERQEEIRYQRARALAAGGRAAAATSARTRRSSSTRPSSRCSPANDTSSDRHSTGTG